VKRFIPPFIAVLAGIGTSQGLRALGQPELVSKLAGLAVVAVVIALFWRNAARAR
jgi:hypothetical protein